MSGIPVSVRFPDFEVSASIFPTTTVSDLKNQISEDCLLSSDQFDLSFEGEDALSNSLVMSMGVMEWSELDAELSPKGLALLTLSQIGSKPTLRRLIREIKNEGDYIKEYVNAGIELNESRSMYSPLTAAVTYHNTAALKILSSSPGIDLNKADARLVTPLSQTCWIQDFECLNILLSNEAVDVNKTCGKNQSTALGTACGLDRLQVVKTLLSDNRIDVNNGNSERTPLGIACAVDNVSVVKVLVSHSEVLVNKKSRSGLTPLYEACKRHHTGSIKLLLKSESLDVTIGSSTQTPVDLLISEGNFDLARCLMSHSSFLSTHPNHQMFINIMYMLLFGYFLSRVLTSQDFYFVVESILEVAEELSRKSFASNLLYK